MSVVGAVAIVVLVVGQHHVVVVLAVGVVEVVAVRRRGRVVVCRLSEPLDLLGETR